MNAKAGHQKIELTAGKREVTGHAVKRLRASGLVPAVLYGKGMDSVNVEVPAKDFERVHKQAGESTLVYLKVGSQEYPTIIHDVTHHPISGATIHADFYKVRLDEKIKTMVPVSFVGDAPAVKDFQGILLKNISELEVEALPAELPHEITVDVSGLKNLEDQITLGTIKGHGWVLTGNPDEVIVSVQAPKSEEELAAELAAPTTDVSAVEVITEKEEPAEGEAAEGEEAPATPAEEAKTE